MGTRTVKLNFGCGSIQPEGWINLDRENFGQTHVGSTELFADDTFDIAVAHCSLQINTHQELPGVLESLRKVIKDRGVLRISLPDIEVGFTAYIDGKKDWFPNGEISLDDRFSNWLTWYSTTRVLLTPRTLINRLLAAGFRSARLSHYRDPLSEAAELDDREHECFFVEAVK